MATIADKPVGGTEQTMNRAMGGISTPEDSDLLLLLQKLPNCTCHAEKIKLVRNVTLRIQKYSLIIVMSTNFSSALEKVIDLAIVPAIRTRDYFSYDKSDFTWYPEIAEGVLGLLLSILNAVKLDPDLPSNSGWGKDNGSQNENDAKGTVCGADGFPSRMQKCIAHVLPKLSVLIGGYAGKHLWSSEKCQIEASNLLKEVLDHFSCDSTHELFTSDILGTFKSFPAGKESSAFSWIMSICQEQLSGNNKWQQNPFLSQVFVYIICQIKSPAINEYFHFIRATSLSFLDDHQISNKIMGLLCLHHLVKHSTEAELKLFGEGYVIYDALKNQMYSKEPDVISRLFPCLLEILKLLEKEPSHRHHHVFQTLLLNAQAENILILRLHYIMLLPVFVNQMGIACVRHLKILLSVISSYLEVKDGVKGQACLGALKLLHCVLQVAWPRMANHSKTIVQMLINVVVCVNYDTWASDYPITTQKDISNLAIECARTLSQLCPDVAPYIKKLQQVEQLKHSVSS